MEIMQYTGTQGGVYKAYNCNQYATKGYHVAYHVCGALTIEMTGSTCWNEKPKTFFESEKKWS